MQRNILDEPDINQKGGRRFSILSFALAIISILIHFVIINWHLFAAPPSEEELSFHIVLPPAFLYILFSIGTFLSVLFSFISYRRKEPVQFFKLSALFLIAVLVLLLSGRISFLFG